MAKDGGNSALLAIFGLACLFLPSLAGAAEDDDHAGHGYVSLTYQFITADSFEATTGEIPIGPVDTHTFFLDIDYHLTDRWTVNFGLPWIRKRYQGNFPHDPLTLDPPRPNIENVDQGDWNSDFQDIHLGVKYLAKDGPLVIEPFVYYGVPSSDYPFFGHAAVGQNLWKLDVGTRFTYFPGLSNAYYRADIAYVFVEETLGVSIDHWKIYGEAGYQFGPHWTGRVFFLWKDGDGLDFPDDFPPPRTTEMWYQHDRMVKHNYLNAGVGLDWNINSTYQVSGNFMVQPWSEQVHVMDYAFSIGISRGF
ncbi:MAG: hypothetical protein R3212_10255 [Xanthomonadales bacterium]|nr:hypothetical protein [Xanthomonadales bacterium]